MANFSNLLGGSGGGIWPQPEPPLTWIGDPVPIPLPEPPLTWIGDPVPIPLPEPPLTWIGDPVPIPLPEDGGIPPDDTPPWDYPEPTDPRSPYPYEPENWWDREDYDYWLYQNWEYPNWNAPGWVPNFPLYQPFPTGFPPYEGSRYEAMGVPKSFYEGVIIPQLQAYQAGQMGDYPTYGGYESGLLGAGQQSLMDLLSGEGVGIPYEAEQYQTAMGRITEGERRAQEELTRLSARGGRLDSGLYGAQQQDITQAAMQQRGETAQDFAIRTAEMQQQAQQFAIPQALQYGQFGAGEARYTYESHAQAWGAETADKFREYESQMDVATTDYEMRTAQNEMVEAGQERAWNAANTEYTRVYESNKAAGMEEYEAVKEARTAALTEYEKLYQSIVQDVQWKFEWVRALRTWEEQLKQVKAGAQQPGVTNWEIFTSFLKLLGLLGGA